MAKKPGTNPKNEFVFFDVVYEDGLQRSNRRVPAMLLGSLEKDEPARGFIIEQDRENRREIGTSTAVHKKHSSCPHKADTGSLTTPSA